MTEKVQKLLKDLNDRYYRLKRVIPRYMDYTDLPNRQVEVLREIVAREKPLIYENDSFGFNRYAAHKIKPLSGNVTPNYGRILKDGFDGCVEKIRQSMATTTDPEKLKFGQDMLESISISMTIVDAYKEIADGRLGEALQQVPHKGARNFYEALVSLKAMIYLLRLNFCAHVTLGRFDQYMYPYYIISKKAGMTDEEALELVEEFFISINRDCDCYTGVQIGDNGQSMVLGGFDGDGNSMYNELSQMCMQASLDLKLIDPKINLRVGKNTSDEIFEFATHLTKAGLGFPQYCNDDVVVPGLVKLGYDREDALNYTVAACWEFIIPNCGADIPNRGVMDFPSVVNRAIHKNLCSVTTFEELLESVKQEIAMECEEIREKRGQRIMAVQPFQSLFFDGCMESLKSMWHGGTKYNNLGAHGLGISTAADALAAVKKQVFEEKAIGRKALLDALNNNFEGTPELRHLLLQSPKMGNNDDYVDTLASFLMDAYSANLNGTPTIRGIWRAGTGSAMEYYLTAMKCPATADGRRAGENYPCSLSPSLGVKTEGLLSVLQSFAKHDYTNIINGGPLTLELHHTVLRNDVGIKKIAQLVKRFVQLGGHQLQLNAINGEQLRHAQQHPEEHPNLIVRVWGWSGYFVELDRPYQDHIISRTQYM